MTNCGSAAVTLRFATSAGSPSTQSAPLPPPMADRPLQGRGSTSIRGPVQTGSGQQYTAGRDQYNAGRDQYLDQSLNLENDYEPMDEVWQGRGFGRVLLVIGVCLALVGFGLWGYNIVSFGRHASDVPDTSSPDLFPPVAIVGAVLFIAGGVLSGVGAGMSKAVRKRSERAARENRWRAES